MIKYDKYKVWYILRSEFNKILTNQNKLIESMSKLLKITYVS